MYMPSLNILDLPTYLMTHIFACIGYYREAKNTGFKRSGSGGLTTRVAVAAFRMRIESITNSIVAGRSVWQWWIKQWKIHYRIRRSNRWRWLMGGGCRKLRRRIYEIIEGSPLQHKGHLLTCRHNRFVGNRYLIFFISV